jgi:hypothetical protein
MARDPNDGEEDEMTMKTGMWAMAAAFLFASVASAERTIDREPRDHREVRAPRDRPEAHGEWDHRHPPEPREWREPREGREGGEAREGREARKQAEAREPRATPSPQETKEQRERREGNERLDAEVDSKTRAEQNRIEGEVGTRQIKDAAKEQAEAWGEVEKVGRDH